MSALGGSLWQCAVCGYVHSGAKPGLCPICGAGHELFLPLTSTTPRPPVPERAESGWRCSICDYVHAGDEPPDVCPVCGANKQLFVPADKKHVATATARRSVGRVLIVGAGIAGVTAAEHARALDPKVAISLVSDEPVLPYYRLNLSRVLAGEVGFDTLPLQPARWYEEQRIDLVYGCVEHIAAEARRVRLRDGRSMGYDSLVLANGAHAFVPPIPGIERNGVHVVRTRADVQRILEHLPQTRRAVCIGGGLLGLEACGGLQARGVEVTVLEGFAWLMPRQLPPRGGDTLAAILTERGITPRCGVSVQAIRGNTHVDGVELADGTVLPAELVIVAAGVRPNTALARSAGLTVKRGVIVDDGLVSSDPHIYCAGDVAEHRGGVYGIWPASYLMGMIAGQNAAGAEARFEGLAPSTRLKVLGIDLFSIGDVQPKDGSDRLVERHSPGRYAGLLVRDGRVGGAALLGDTELSAALKDAVEARAQLVELPHILSHFDA